MERHKIFSSSFRVCLMGMLGLLLTNITAKAQAEIDFTVGQLDYKILSIEEMTVEAFVNNNNMISIEVPQTVIYENKEYRVIGIGDYAFQESRLLKEINLNEGLRYIGTCAFQGCNALEEITIPNSVEQIESACFRYCMSLTKVELPPHLKEIPHSCFFDCYSLSSIKIPDSVNLIDIYAFTHCHSLKSLELPSNAKIIGSAISSCAELKEIILNDNPYYCFQDGFLYSKDKSILIANLQSNGEEVEIKDCVNIIGEGAFSWNFTLKTVIIPNSVVAIRSDAFGDNDYLKTIICYAIVPPRCAWNTLHTQDVYYDPKEHPKDIFVPDESVELYNSRGPWRGHQIYPLSKLSGIEEIASSLDSDLFNVYTLDGRMVKQTKDRDFLNLPSGIYIVNGRKVMISK